jgi:membrane-associated phospholipid phosphatase
VKYLKQLFREKSFVFLVLPFLLGMAYLIIAYGKGPSHLLINQWNSPFKDTMFKYVTHLGDGAVFAVVIVALLFFRFRWALMELAAALLTLLLVFVTKQLLFNGLPRPVTYFENAETLHLVEGVKMHSMNSFPSGHTMTAFAIFMILVLITKNKFLKIVWVVIAILAGYSRVYLSQHFLGDVLAGAIMGILIAVSSCSLIDNLSIFKRNWTDKNLLQLSDKKNDQ